MIPIPITIAFPRLIPIMINVTAATRLSIIAAFSETALLFFAANASIKIIIPIPGAIKAVGLPEEKYPIKPPAIKMTAFMIMMM